MLDQNKNDSNLRLELQAKFLNLHDDSLSLETEPLVVGRYFYSMLAEAEIHNMDELGHQISDGGSLVDKKKVTGYYELAQVRPS